ncbi:MAG: metallophosphoesterase [Puniceicoccaceae bacterium 5H]|nr:MAG: metallophosphoesterase [Puniceicoccaceae bacterium 5H]
MKFLHTADWQLGKPYGRIQDLDKRARARQERVEAVRRMTALVREHEASCVVVAGDLFDSSTVDKSTVSAGLSAIGGLEVPVLVIPGNHDHGGPGGIWEQDFFNRERASLAPNLTVWLEAKPVAAHGAIWFPCPLLRRQEQADATAWLRDPEVFAQGGAAHLPRVVVAHGSTMDFGSQAEAEDDEAAATHLNLDRLPMEACDYVALGDWHGTKQAGPKAWYAGTPEPDRFPKGSDYAPGQVLLVEVERRQAPRVTALSTGRLAWHQREHRLEGSEALPELERELTTQLGQRAQEDCLWLRLRGHVGLEGRKALDSLLDTLKARLLRLKLSDSVALTPTDDEIAALTTGEDPLIASVAQHFIQLAQDPEQAAVARAALQELHAQLR